MIPKGIANAQIAWEGLDFYHTLISSLTHIGNVEDEHTYLLAMQLRVPQRAEREPRVESY